MGKFDQVAAALEALLHRQPERALTALQIADLQGRLADPGEIASDAEAEAFFTRFEA